MIARHIRVTGRVQGVFFRQWTCKQARQCGVTGWVRNRPEGSVEAHVEGDEAAVNALVKQMRRGPPSARVDDLVIHDVAPERPAGFEVRR